MQIPQLIKALLFLILLYALASCNIIEQPNEATDFTPSEACIEVLHSNCNATQQELLDELLVKLEIYGRDKQQKTYPGTPPAFEALPKDGLGLINWIKAETYHIIEPRNALDGKEPKPTEGFLHNLIFMQTKVYLMADVIFPHGMHTHWMNCNSCHPKPFKKKSGSNNITMKEIIAGKWCGKCHGKVAFSPKEYPNCQRCHVLSKKKY